MTFFLLYSIALFFAGYLLCHWRDGRRRSTPPVLVTPLHRAHWRNLERPAVWRRNDSRN